MKRLLVASSFMYGEHIHIHSSSPSHFRIASRNKRIELPVIYLRWLAGCSQGESRKLKEQRDDAVMELRRMQGRDQGLDLERLEATEAAIKEALQKVSREKERVIKERLDGESVSYLLG